MNTAIVAAVLVIALCAACAACCGYVLVIAFGVPSLPAVIIAALLAVGMFMALAATEEDNE
jgi:hypothetical protein